MVSRIHEEELRRWWYNHVDQFILQQAELRQQREKTVKDQVLFSDLVSDLYDILWVLGIYHFSKLVRLKL